MKKLLAFVVILVVALVCTVGVTRGDAWVGALLLGWLILRAAPGMWRDLRDGFTVIRTLDFKGRGVRRRDLSV